MSASLFNAATTRTTSSITSSSSSSSFSRRLLSTTTTSSSLKSTTNNNNNNRKVGRGAVVVVNAVYSEKNLGSATVRGTVRKSNEDRLAATFNPTPQPGKPSVITVSYTHLTLPTTPYV